MLSLVCGKHNEKFDFLCAESGCSANRQCCLLCKMDEHRGHDCIEISRIDAHIYHLKQSPTSTQSHQVIGNIHKMSSALAEYKESEKKLSKMMATFNNKLYNILKPVNVIELLLEGKLNQHCRTFLTARQELDPIASVVRFVANPQIQNWEQLGHIIETITSHMKQIIREGMDQMENSFTRLIHQIQQIEISQWLNLYQRKRNIQRLAKSMQQSHRVKAEQINPQPENINTKYIVKTERDLDEDLISLLPLSTSPSLMTFSQHNMHANPTISEQASQYTRYVFDMGNKKITKSEILEKLKELKKNKNYKQYLREFIVQTPNEFDGPCLKYITSYFPSLTKLNYLFNFEEDGLQLQKDQVFFENKRKLQFGKAHLPLSEKSFNCFAGLTQLQNIAIDQAGRFCKKNYKINNPSLKHITIGRYMTKKKIDLPASLGQFILSYSSLISLNLFNIKTIDGSLLGKVITNNNRTLVNLWLSECQETKGNFFKAIAQSRIESIIFDQNKNIKHQLIVPNTIKTLILENCEFQIKTPVRNLSKATCLNNFSIFESTFPPNCSIGPYLLQKISTIPPTKLSYLNFGDCSTINSQSLISMRKMPNLKELCLDYTNVELEQLLKQSWIKNLQKLGIVGVKLPTLSTQLNGDNQLHKQNNIEILLRKCQNLKSLSLKFDQDLTKIDHKYLAKLEHISIECIDKNKQSLKKFQSSFKKLNISVHLESKKSEPSSSNQSGSSSDSEE